MEASPGRVADIFGQMVSSPMELMFFMGLTVLVGFAVCAGGVQGSLEKVTKFMMLGLLGLIILLAVNSVMIPGGEKGIAFYLLPDWGRAVEAGLGSRYESGIFHFVCRPGFHGNICELHG